MKSKTKRGSEVELEGTAKRIGYGWERPGFFEAFVD